MLKKFVVMALSVFVLSSCCTKRKSCELDAENNPLAAEFKQHVGDTVFFAFDKSDLSKVSKEQLKKEATWLNAHKDLKITIEGHCDERGTREYNLALGERRAETARKFLEANGIDSSRMDTISYGKERPAIVGHDEAAWSQNRRAVTTLSK